MPLNQAHCTLAVALIAFLNLAYCPKGHAVSQTTTPIGQTAYPRRGRTPTLMRPRAPSGLSYSSAKPKPRKGSIGTRQANVNPQAVPITHPSDRDLQSPGGLRLLPRRTVSVSLPVNPSPRAGIFDVSSVAYRQQYASPSVARSGSGETTLSFGAGKSFCYWDLTDSLQYCFNMHLLRRSGR